MRVSLHFYPLVHTSQTHKISVHQGLALFSGRTIKIKTLFNVAAEMLDSVRERKRKKGEIEGEKGKI